MKGKAKVIYCPLVGLLALVIVGASFPGARAQETNRVGLVVRFGDGSAITRCVEFSESGITGYDVLTRSRLAVVAAFDSGMGAAVCAIEGTGCSVEECLTCSYPNYWSYWHLNTGSWVYSPAGASAHRVHNGDVEGWSWGVGEPPPVVPFDQICTTPATDTPTPTNTPVPPTAASRQPGAPPPLPPATSPTPTATAAPPTATAPPPTPAVSFRLNRNPIPAGTCTVLHWNVSNATEVYLDGESVDRIGSREVCPAASQEYNLHVAGAAGEQTHTLVLDVTAAPEATSTPEPTASPSPAPTVQLAAAASPTPSPSPSPPPAPQVVVAVSSSPSPTPTPSPRPTQPATSIPQPTIDLQQPASSEQHPTTASWVSYMSFGLIAAGLIGLLAFRTLRWR
jgi:hypothetical protein